MKFLYPLILLFFLKNSLYSQVSIGNIINDYTPVLSIDISVCENLVTVEDASAFKVDDTVLIIQMKGAVIDSSNSSSFGTITSYGNGGNYEFSYVKSISGNVIQLKSNLNRQYNAPDGLVQLIRVPYYTSAVVTSSLTCLPWDGKKGGVLVLVAKDTIKLNASIDVSGKGFRGGKGTNNIPSDFNCNETDYYYPLNSSLAGAKGEGIANISDSKLFGRGALANGGGGGNSHNAGGGGGANGSQGGAGGFQFEGSIFTPTPCTPTSPFDNGGVPGNPLGYSNISNAIFLGGGGGAGHANNPDSFLSPGGNGGGIIILRTRVLEGNSMAVVARGDSAATCGLGNTGCHEGMGGGGAGGVIVLESTLLTGNVLFDLRGGKGGDLVAASNNGKVGPGGGGSGGVFWTNLLNIPVSANIDVNGGQNGRAVLSANDSWGATPGQNGILLNGFNMSLVIPCSTVPLTITSFTALARTSTIELNWQSVQEVSVKSYVIKRAVNASAPYTSLGTLSARGSSTSNTYYFEDKTALPGIKYYYKLLISDMDGKETYSAIRTAEILKRSMSLTIFPNPSKGIVKVMVDNLNESAEIAVSNNIGQVIMRKVINRSAPVVLDISKQPSGNYWLTLQTSRGKQVYKMVKL